jgi:hypothetical protein
MWTLSHDLRALLLVAMWSGMTWAAHEHGSFLLFFDTMKKHERTSVLTTHNLARSFFMVGGSLVGAAYLRAAGQDYQAYATLFWVASGARLVAIALLLRVGRGERVVPERRIRRSLIPGTTSLVGVPLTGGRTSPR